MSVVTPQPHYIPGYTGYCPQFIFRTGDTYGSLTHKILIDPAIKNAEKLILSDRADDEYHMFRPTLREIDLVNNRNLDNDTIYQHPFVPGYEGYIPNALGKFGTRFAVSATEGVAEFEKECQKSKIQARKLRHRSAPISTIYNRSLGERTLQENDYKLPLSAVRPEAAGTIKETHENIPTPPEPPYSRHLSPYFMENDDPEKYFKQGYTGHKPFLWPRFGESGKNGSNSALYDFTNNYQHRKSTEWAPITNTAFGNIMPSAPVNEIYHENIGLVPNYQGHVPGAMFRYGQTYGNDTRDAKSCLKKC